MNGIFEILLALNKFEDGLMNAERVASIIYGNIQVFNSFETSDLFLDLRYIQCSLEDVEFSGCDHSILDIIKKVKIELESMIVKRTKKISITKYFGDYEINNFLYKENIYIENIVLEFLRSSLEASIYICWINHKGSLVDFKNFNSFNDLSDFIYSFM